MKKILLPITALGILLVGCTDEKVKDTTPDIEVVDDMIEQDQENETSKVLSHYTEDTITLNSIYAISSLLLADTEDNYKEYTDTLNLYKKTLDKALESKKITQEEFDKFSRFYAKSLELVTFVLDNTDKEFEMIIDEKAYELYVDMYNGYYDEVVRADSGALVVLEQLVKENNPKLTEEEINTYMSFVQTISVDEMISYIGTYMAFIASKDTKEIVTEYRVQIEELIQLLEKAQQTNNNPIIADYIKLLKPFVAEDFTKSIEEFLDSDDLVIEDMEFGLLFNTDFDEPLKYYENGSNEIEIKALRNLFNLNAPYLVYEDSSGRGSGY